MPSSMTKNMAGMREKRSIEAGVYVGRLAAATAVLSAVLLAVALFVPASALATCACGGGDGRMTAYFPGIAPISIDGDMSDWPAILADQDNNICDAPPGVDLDAPIQSTGRDLMQFAYTYDSSYVYAYTARVASSTNTDKFIYYADTNNNGIMETGEPVVVVAWQGSNKTVSVYLGTYQSYYPGGDPMVCTAGYTAGQSCTVGKADGYHLPGTVLNLPGLGHPTYSGQWGSVTGTEMEWKVSWADLGMSSTPGRAFTFHVSSTNSNPGAGSFPSQVDDNMGGCGGGGGSSQYAGVTISGGSTYVFPASLTLNLRHTITNTGNGNDSFALGFQTGSGLAPSSVAFYQDNGSGQPTGPALTATPTLGPNGTFAVVAVLTWTAGPNVNGPGTYTVTATSTYDIRYSAPATDTVQAAPWITIAKQTTNSQYGSFGFCGTNGPPACTSPVTLTTAAGTNPATSRYLATVNAQATITEQTAPAGWDLTGIQCSDGTNSIGSVSGSTVTIPTTSLIAGANLACTFTNKKRAAITVQKALAPTGDTFALKVGATTVVTGGDGASGSTTVAADTAVAISETAASGSLTNYYATYSCTDGTSGVGTSFALTPAAGANITCTFSNTKWATLIIKKNAPNGYNNTVFTYDVTGPNSFSASTTATINNSGSGTAATIQLPTSKTGQLVYDIVEEPKSGWNTTGIACIGAVSTSTDPNNNRRIFINVNPGSAVTCTFTNAVTSNPQVVIKKQSYGGTGAFSYSGGTNGLPASLTLNTANANPDTSSTYAVTAGSSTSITETLLAGWTLTGIDCRDASNTAITGSSGWLNTATGTLTIPGTYLTNGAYAACTFLNNKDASLTIQENASGGDGQFSFSVAGPNSFSASRNVTTSGGSGSAGISLPAGSTSTNAYTLTETSLPAGWSLTGLSCSGATGSAPVYDLFNKTVSLGIKPGDAVICTCSNGKNPTVTLKEQSYGGSGSFTFSGGTNGLPANLALDTTATYPNPVSSSAYTVTTIGQAAVISETIPSNWSLAGVQCVDDSNTVVSDGTWLNLSGGTGTFTIPGTALGAGVNLACTFNNKKNAAITVQKSLKPTTDGGKFNLRIGGTVYAANVGDGGSTGAQAVAAADTAVTLDEIEGTGTSLTHYDTTYSCSGGGIVGTKTGSGTSISLAAAEVIAGSSISCTFTNKRKATITVQKSLLPTTDSGRFTLRVGGNDVASNVGDGGSNAATPAEVAADTAVTVDEIEGINAIFTNYATSYSCTAAGSGWIKSGSGTVISLAGTDVPPGGVITCTFTNVRKPTVVLMKQSLNGTGSFTFGGGTNGLPANLTLDTSVSNPAPPPPYTPYLITTIGQSAAITETVPAGWALTGVSCVDGSGNPVGNTTLSGGTLTIPAAAVVAGATLTCTFSNVLLANITVVKSADKSTVKPGEVITYTVQVVNTGAGTAANVTLDDGMSPYTSFRLLYNGSGPSPFQFIEGTPASGLTLGTPVYSSNKGSTWTYAPVSGGGGASAGYDGGVTNWRIPMTGTMSAGGASFTLRYQMLAK